MYKIEKNKLLFQQYHMEASVSGQVALKRLQEVTLSGGKGSPFTRISDYVFMQGKFDNNGLKCTASPRQVSPRGSQNPFLPQVEGTLLQNDNEKCSLMIKVSNAVAIVVLFILNYFVISSLVFGRGQEALRYLLIAVIDNSVVLLHSNYAAKKSVKLLNKVICEPDGAKELIDEAHYWSSVGKGLRDGKDD